MLRMVSSTSLGQDVPAGSDDYFFAPTVKIKITVIIHVPQVARAEPATLSRFARKVGAPKIP